MTKKERYRKFLEYIAANKPSVNTELKYYNPYQLIVSVILSAQCTDKRVNLITPEFFKKFPTVHNLAGATVNEIYELIKSCSYPNNKAKHLLGMAHALTERYDRAIPSDIAELQKIPGIGRKSANVLASVLFNKPVIAVDTHVYRVSARIGLTLNAVTPVHT
ncbi:MAG: endonuclease III, partial [Bacteroidia bacterium]|nr:endonuclease III [Bacteroidia bacterium]